MRVTVLGLWHLGCVTAACLAEAGHDVTGLDTDGAALEGLRRGRAPVAEPGLDDSIAAGLASGKLRFESTPAAGLAGAELVWVCIDTPVGEDDQPDLGAVRECLERMASHVPAGAFVLISSQVPVGFTRDLARDWNDRGLRFAVSPENLRLGSALAGFRAPERVALGVMEPGDARKPLELLSSFCSDVQVMSLESAELVKHALNAFLATSVAFANEMARLSEAVGADAKAVERALKSDARIGARAYLAPGAPFAGGTLARDLRFLAGLGDRHRVEIPVVAGALASNQAHRRWLRTRIVELMADVSEPRAAILGLTYKAYTSTLRRSEALDLARFLRDRGARVRGHDPAVPRLPAPASDVIELCARPADALAGADVAVIATPWDEYRKLEPSDFIDRMRRPVIVDPGWFLASALAQETRLTYVAPGRGVAPKARG